MDTVSPLTSLVENSEKSSDLIKSLMSAMQRTVVDAGRLADIHDMGDVEKVSLLFSIVFWRYILIHCFA